MEQNKTFNIYLNKEIVNQLEVTLEKLENLYEKKPRLTIEEVIKMILLYSLSDFEATLDEEIEKKKEIGNLDDYLKSVGLGAVSTVNNN